MSHLGHRLSALIDGELTPGQRDRVLAHLARCEPCRTEAASLRLLKQRMHTLGETTASSSLHDRLLALATVPGPATRGRWWRPSRRPVGYPAGGRARLPVRSLTVAGLVLLGAGVPAAAFLVGGPQQEPGPSVTPAVDLFRVQHAITTGQVPAREPAGQPGSVPAARPGSSRQAQHPAAGRGSARTPLASARPRAHRDAGRAPAIPPVLSPAVTGAGGR